MISFFILFTNDQTKYKNFTEKRYDHIVKMVVRETHERRISKDFISHLEILDFDLFLDYKMMKGILEDKNVLIKTIYNEHFCEVMLLESKTKNYIFIQTPSNYLLLIDKLPKNTTNLYMILIFLGLLIMFGLLYYMTIYKLYPLKKLQQSIKSLGEEDYNIECATDKKDEISLLANEFDQTSKKLKNFKESRNVFIRNIMHELKTPITKGKFLTELPQNNQNQEKMREVFYRLEGLINEFASIEELISTKTVLEKKSYYLADIVDNAVDILMCDESSVLHEYDNLKLDVNFKFFSIAIKNFLDNGIKYSPDKKVIVKSLSGDIIIENKGKRLSYPLKNYFNPFFKGDEVTSNQSFGLGLYIVKHILDAHGFTLYYKYENNYNKITISIK